LNSSSAIMSYTSMLKVIFDFIEESSRQGRESHFLIRCFCICFVTAAEDMPMIRAISV
jgi:uncharacterized membrane protein